MDASLYQKSDGEGPRLRIGILVDSLKLPRWIAEVCDHIQGSNFASIELVITDAGDDKRNAAESEYPFLRFSRSNQLLRLYLRCDRISAAHFVDPLLFVDCSDRFASIKVLKLFPVVDGAEFKLSSEDVTRVCLEQLDVLLSFRLDRPASDVFGAARFGIWSYQHGRLRYGHAGIPYLWELLEGTPECVAALVAMSADGDTPLVLCEGIFAANSQVSRAHNCVQPYWGAATFVIQKLCELHARGWDQVRRRAVRIAKKWPDGAGYLTPTNGEMLQWLLQTPLRKALKWPFRRSQVKHWQVAFRIGTKYLSEPVAPLDINTFTWIESPAGSAYADPFVASAEGRTWVFFEDYDYSKKKGRIACAELTDGRLGEKSIVLEMPFHLSYPCVFEDSGTWYMIPEAALSGSVDLYRCHRFPYEWRRERPLVKGYAVDSTAFKYGGRFWLFVTHVEHRGGACQLWLYSASSLAGQFIPHPMNPISTDIRHARGGGGIFERQGKLYRPSQDGLGEYGRCLVFNEVEALNEEEYREAPCARVEAGKDSALIGLHTYNCANNVEVIDGLQRVSNRIAIEEKNTGTVTRFARNAFANWTALVYAAVTGFFLSPFVVAHLGSAQYGVWSLVAGLVGYLGLLDLGIRQAVNKYTASLRAKEEHQECSRIVSAAVKLFAMLGMAAIMLAGLLSGLAPYLFNIPESFAPHAQQVVFITGVAVAVTLVSGAFGGVVTGIERFDIMSAIEIFVVTARTAATVFVLQAGHGILALAWIHLAAAVLNLALCWQAAHRLYPRLTIRPLQDLHPQVRTIVSFGMSLTALYALGSITHLSDPLVIGAVLPIESVAYFAIGSNLYFYARQVPVSLAFLMTPRVSALANDKSERVGDVVISVARVATILSSVFAITFFFRGESFISLWMGPAFGPLCSGVLQVFAIVLILDAARYVVVHSLTGMGQQRLLIRGYLLEAFSKLFLSIALVSPLGIVGVAVGTLLPAMFMALIYFPRRLAMAASIPVACYLKYVFLRPMLACVPFLLASVALETYAPASRLDIFFLQTIAILPLVPLLAWHLCFKEEDRLFMRTLVERLLSRDGTSRKP